MKGNPVLSLSASGTEGRAIRNPTITINARIPLPKYPYAMAIGTYRPASVTSSDMCAVASEPVSVAFVLALCLG